jgi:hypothetical protein
MTLDHLRWGQNRYKIRVSSDNSAQGSSPARWAEPSITRVAMSAIWRLRALSV